MDSSTNTRQPLLVSKKDAAASLGVCLRTVDHLLAEKELACVRIGKRVMIKYSSLVTFCRHDHVGTSEQQQ